MKSSNAPSSSNLSTGPTRRRFLKSTLLGGAAFSLCLSDGLPRDVVDAKELPRSTPREEGIAESHLIEFVDAMEREGHELHGLMVLRRGKVIAEGWARPYGPKFNHSMYSLSKSFTSTGVGLAVAEGLIKVMDKVVSFFPEAAPDKISDRLAALDIRHLLTMSAGMASSATGKTTTSKDWVRTFLAQPLVHDPGTVFNYNTAATYMLSAIIQKVSGDKLIDYLRPRLFEPIGIVGPTWDECPAGINKGGFGLNITTEGLARFGQLYLQRGRWNGKQVLPAAWVKDATSKQIQQGTDSNKNPDWQQGYGYQFWRCRHDGYRGDGAFGQFTIVLPKQEVVIAMSSETASMQGELDLVWKLLLPNFTEVSSAPGTRSDAVFQRKLKSLKTPFPQGDSKSGLAKKWHGKTIRFEPDNPMGLDEVVVTFEKGTVELAAGSDSRGDWNIECGSRKWRRGAMPLPSSGSWLISKGKTDKRGFVKVAASFAWAAENALEMAWRYYETPHHDVVRMVFDDGGVTLELRDSMGLRRGKPQKPKMTLKGKFA
ncbi:MAG: CubicO group peptidase (beta-lactamase class C family) [Candidatus Binatia bacterium]|jgi:CubicO group peptidase (beta-lactamase class C family)